MRGVPTAREQLLEAAIQLIDRDGEAGVKIDRVSELAEIAKPSIYRYFVDRDGLIIAAQAERYRRSMGIQVPEIDDYLARCTCKADFVELIDRTIASFDSPEGAARRRLRVQVLASASTRPSLQAAIDAAHRSGVDDLAAILALGQRNGWVETRFTARSLAEWWFGVIIGRYLVEHYGEREDEAAWGVITLDVVNRLLFGDEWVEAHLSVATGTATEQSVGG